jgi:hypothetical protein
MGDVKSQLFRNSSRPPRQSENVTLSITYIYITLQAHRNETFLFAFAVTANLKRNYLNPGVTGWLLLRRHECLGIFIGPATFA